MTGPGFRNFPAVLGLSFLVLAPAAVAETIGGAYTPLVLKHCENVTPPKMAEHRAVLHRAGYGGLTGRVAEGDLRMFVSYGEGAARQKSAGQTLRAFNSTGDTLEWRLKDGKPLATILRFRWDSDDLEGSTLVGHQVRRDRCLPCCLCASRAEPRRERACPGDRRQGCTPVLLRTRSGAHLWR